MVAVSHHRKPLVINELFWLRYSYLIWPKLNTFLPPQKKEITHFCVGSSTMTLQELTKLHRRIACGKAQHFLHFCFQVQLLLQIFGLFSQLFCFHTSCIFALFSRMSFEDNDSVTRGKPSYWHGRQSHKTVIIVVGCNWGKKWSHFKADSLKSALSFTECYSKLLQSISASWRAAEYKTLFFELCSYL